MRGSATVQCVWSPSTLRRMKWVFCSSVSWSFCCLPSSFGMLKFVDESMQICCWELHLEFMMMLLLKTIQFCDESGELSYALVVRKLLLFIASELEYMVIFIGSAGETDCAIARSCAKYLWVEQLKVAIHLVFWVVLLYKLDFSLEETIHLEGDNDVCLSTVLMYSTCYICYSMRFLSWPCYYISTMT